MPEINEILVTTAGIEDVFREETAGTEILL